MLDVFFRGLKASHVAWTVDILYKGLGISKLQVFIEKRHKKNFQLYHGFFLSILVIKTLDDPDPGKLEMQA